MVGDVTKVTFIGDVDDTEFQVILHYQTLTSFGPKEVEYDGLIDALEENYFNKVLTNDALDFLHQDFSFKEIQLRDIDNDTIGRNHLLNPLREGEIASDQLPAQLSVMVQKRTPLIGRSFQGRNHFPFGSEGQNTGGKWNIGFVQDVSDWFITTTAIISASLLQSFQLVIYSKVTFTSTFVTTTSVLNDARTIRGRAE